MLDVIDINKSSVFSLREETSVAGFLLKLHQNYHLKNHDFISLDYRGKYGLIKIIKRGKSPIKIRFVIISENNKDLLYTIKTEDIPRLELKAIALDLTKNFGYTEIVAGEFLDVSKQAVRNLTVNPIPRIRMTKK